MATSQPERSPARPTGTLGRLTARPQIADAAPDVFDLEPLPVEHPLAAMAAEAHVERAATHPERWSDCAPVTVAYDRKVGPGAGRVTPPAAPGPAGPGACSGWTRG